MVSYEKTDKPIRWKRKEIYGAMILAPNALEGSGYAVADIRYYDDGTNAAKRLILEKERREGLRLHNQYIMVTRIIHIPTRVKYTDADALIRYIYADRVPCKDFDAELHQFITRPVNQCIFPA